MDLEAYRERARKWLDHVDALLDTMDMMAEKISVYRARIVVYDKAGDVKLKLLNQSRHDRVEKHYEAAVLIMVVATGQDSVEAAVNFVEEVRILLEQIAMLRNAYKTAECLATILGAANLAVGDVVPAMSDVDLSTQVATHREVYEAALNTLAALLPASVVEQGA